MSLYRRRTRTIFAAAAIGLLYAVAAGPAAAEDAPEHKRAVRYQLIEEWSIAAQGPVHLREKRVRAKFQLDVTDLGVDSMGQRRLEIRFAQVAVEADIPAQKRMGEFDSENPPEEFTLEHHELAGPIALLGQTLQLTFAPDGTLTAIGGTEGASRRLDEMYDKFLRGSEQDLHTRDIERRKISPEELRRSWADAFVGRKADRTPTDQPLERSAEAVFMACIPTESWMTQVAIPVAETVRFTPRADGGAQVDKTAVMAESKFVRTTMGGVDWTYTPAEAKCETTIEIAPNGLVESINSSRTAVLSSTLSVGADVPIQMTITHSTELSRP